MTLLRSFASILTGRLLSVLIATVNSILIARLLGVEGNGIYSLFLLIANTMMVIWNVGLPSSLTYYLASKKNTFSEGLQFAGLFSFLLFVLGSIFLGIVSIFGITSFREGLPNTLYILSIFTFFFLLLNNLLLAVLQGDQRFKTYSLLVVLQPMALLAGLILPIFNKTVENVAIVFIISHAIQSFFLFILYGKTLIGLFALRPEWDTVKMYFRYGIKNHLSNILTLINYKADLYFINYFHGAVSLGLYSISVLVAEKIWILSGVITTVIFPRLSSITNEDSSKAKLTIFISKWALILAILASCFILIFGDIFIRLLFGGEFEGAILPLFILLPGICATSMSRIISTDIASRDKSELNFYVSLVTVALNLTLNWFLIPVYGMIGAAIATSFTYGLNLLLKLMIYKRIVLATFNDFFSLDFERQILRELRKRKI